MAPPSGSRNSKATRDYYHHMIPRFILVRFQSTAHMSKKQREKIYKKTKKDARKVQFYELATGVLGERSFSDVYGVKNLYRDASSMQDVDELEAKLAVLEQAAKVVVDRIHDGVESGTACMLRSELETLRKFLFLMQYRMDDLSVKYFDSDHATSTDIWLHFLRYYLDTPHNTLLDEGERWLSRWISRGVDSPKFHPDDDQNSAAGTYWKQATFSLGIWCAAENREFILTHNDMVSGCGKASRLAFLANPEIHRLFVLSPQIAIVLRSHDDQVCDHVRSDLADIDMKPPSVQYAVSGPGNPFHSTSISDRDIFRRSAYMAGPGQKDMLTFPITRLTSKQTDEFNLSFCLTSNRMLEAEGFLSVTPVFVEI
ncbi:hypothetical protein BDZ89DRAFT_1157434 [Hymenopellis radicata]|nr:hypothetical protein BDZ89DRAFT_1157434 [Hymenopellis radicata]